MRSNLVQNRIARVLFYVDGEESMVLLHVFIKKTQKTPPREMDIARSNKKLHEAESNRRNGSWQRK